MAKSAAASISLPGEIANELDELARREHRTRSGIIQEAVRQYLEMARWRDLQRGIRTKARHLKIASDDDIERLVDEVRS